MMNDPINAQRSPDPGPIRRSKARALLGVLAPGNHSTTRRQGGGRYSSVVVALSVALAAAVAYGWVATANARRVRPPVVSEAAPGIQNEDWTGSRDSKSGAPTTGSAPEASIKDEVVTGDHGDGGDDDLTDPQEAPSGDFVIGDDGFDRSATSGTSSAGLQHRLGSDDDEPAIVGGRR